MDNGRTGRVPRVTFEKARASIPDRFSHGLDLLSLNLNSPSYLRNFYFQCPSPCLRSRMLSKNIGKAIYIRMLLSTFIDPRIYALMGGKVRGKTAVGHVLH